MYRKVAPIDKPKTTINDPIHLPNIKPPKIAIGAPNPAAKTQIIVNKRNSVANKNKFEFLNSKK